MRVALDEQIFAIQAYGGISRMFAELARQFVIGQHNDVEVLPLKAPVITRYLLDDPELRQALGVHEAKNEWTALARYFTRLRIHPHSEIVHNTFYLPHGLAPTRGAKRIVTVHDMIPELMPYTRRRLDLLTLKRRYVDSADHVICVSEATKRDLLEVYGPIEAPISVVHHGVDSRFTAGDAPLPDWPDRYVLMVGNRSQYKDADVLFRAFSRLAPEYSDLHLVCLGGGAFNESESTQINELKIADRCHQFGLPDELMPAAYSNATVFVFPSRFEGFGLPALEAMACGTPTVLADATSLPEVGSDAALYFPTGDEVALAAQIARVLEDPLLVSGLRMRGLARASQFSWQEAANRTEAVYAQALSS
jgi:glycosyltransferase involved in cell wall biosynthesis